MENVYKIITNKQEKDIINDGYTKLPQIINNHISQSEVAQLIENKDRIYTSSTKYHKEYIKKNNIYTHLKYDLNILAKKYLKAKHDFQDTYEITRITKGTQKSESYLGHFDSHLFTLVTPIIIPNTQCEESGQLILFPKIRNEPSNEFKNILGKIYYKKFHNKKRFTKLMQSKKFVELDFKDNNPVLFLGRVSLHGNRGFEKNMNEHRITLLTHFFDPSPKYGIGNILRKIRSR